VASSSSRSGAPAVAGSGGRGGRCRYRLVQAIQLVVTISAMVCPVSRRCAAHASLAGSTTTGRPTRRPLAVATARAYSIGDRTPGLTRNPDGSLDLILSHTSPAGSAANWLPAPAGPFQLLLGLYAPAPAAANGTWPAPVITAR